MGIETHLLLFLMHLAAIAFLIIGILLWMHCRRNSMRFYLAITFVWMSLAIAICLLPRHVSVTPHVFSLTYSLHILLFLLFCLFVIVRRWQQRLPGPRRVSSPSFVAAETVALPPPSAESLVSDISTDQLQLRLDRLMNEVEIWRDADLSLEKLASALGTNRNRVGQLIRERGHEGYKDFINRRRIDEFLRLAAANRDLNIQETFIAVGYRSKMTALRYFKEYVGGTPSEYLQNISQQEIIKGSSIN